MEPAVVLKNLRQETGLSQAKFAAKFDIPLSTYEHWEMGTRRPPDYVIALLQVAVRNTKYSKEWFEEVVSEIKELAKLHSIEVPMVYGDGTETTDKMISLEELGRILSEIEDTISHKK